MSGEFDPIVASVLQNRLQAISREMATRLMRSARSPIFNELGDLVTVLFDASARTLAQTEYAAIIAFGAEPSLEHIVARFGDEIFDGDVFIHNDVYSGSNQNADIGIYLPVFAGSELVAWTSGKGHMADIGGSTLGGYNPDTREVWQEALRIPPLKLVERGELRRDVWDMVAANIRLPVVMEDVRAMIGACAIGRLQLLDLIDSYGKETFESYGGHLIELADRQVRRLVESWPDGTYRGESWMVSDGLDPTRRYRIACIVTIAGDEITFDFGETDDQAPGFTNMPPASAMGAVRIAFLMLLTAAGLDIPTNQGLFGPLRTVFREGSLLDPRFPAATVFGNQMCDEIVEAVMLALAEVVPELVTAGWNQIVGMGLVGIDPRLDEPFVAIPGFPRGGPGAMHGADGYDALGFTGTVGQMRAPDIEMFELFSPHFVEHIEYATDSAGAGEWRGGLGTTSAWRCYGVDEFGVTLGDDMEHEGAEPAPGLFGGLPAGLNTLRVEFPDGSRKDWGSKQTMLGLSGARIEARLGGGAGYGDPRHRPPEAVLRDVRDGVVSNDEARRSYGVAIDESSWTVDDAATAALRDGRPA